MKENKVLWALLLMLVVAGLTAMTPQEKNPPAQHYAYDSSSQQTLEGNVVETKDYHCPVSGTLGSHITIKANNGDLVEVHMAPASFMKQYEIMIRKGDRVTVIGSRIIFEGKPALVAKSVILGNDTYNFRDGKGRPLW